MSDMLPEIQMPPQQEKEEEETENITAEINDIVEEKERVPEPVQDPVDVISEKHKEEPEAIFEEEKPKKSRARKIPLSDKQKEHLEKARVKGLEVRRKKAAERKAQKQEETKKFQKMKEEEEKELLQKKYKIDHPVNKVYQLNDEMIQKLKEDAIEGYDTKRKARKAKKKAEKQEKEVVQRSVRAITSAVKPNDPDDVYASCFGFS